MILQTKEESPTRGSIVCGAGGHWCALPPGADGLVLTASANDPGGWGLAWVATIPQSQVTGLTTALAAKATDTAVVHLAGAETITGAKTFSGAIGVNGAAPPAQAASPGTAAGTDAAADAAVINAIALVLKNLGFTL